MARHFITPLRPKRLGDGQSFLSLYRDVNRLIDEAFRNGLPGFAEDVSEGDASRYIDARMNVSETETEFRITAELPGVAEEDIDINLKDDVLTISGEKRMEKKDEKENFYAVERSFGAFQRSFRLPYSVDPEQVEAEFRNGVLTVTMPKAPQDEHMHHIAVKGTSSQKATTEGPAEGTTPKKKQ